jgi:hypothetical protein
MIEHNFEVFKKAIDDVFQVRSAMLERQRAAGSAGARGVNRGGVRGGKQHGGRGGAHGGSVVYYLLLFI